MYMCLKVPNINVCDWKMFLIHDIPRWPYSLGMLNCLYHSPVNFSKGGMESFFTCAHFCPTYGEVTLQCQNITFMNGSDDGELRGQSHEIWYAYHLLCIIFIFYSPTPFINMCPVYWLHFDASCCIIFLANILPFVGGCIHCISCVHSVDCCTYLVSLVALAGYLTCVSFLSQ